jgi:hypothetical protein
MTEGVWPEGAELKSIFPIPIVAEFSIFSASLMKACIVQKKLSLLPVVWIRIREKIIPDPGSSGSEMNFEVKLLLKSDEILQFFLNKNTQLKNLNSFSSKKCL